jgi:hypothetical protein
MDYRELFGENALRDRSKWVVSTLVWLLFFFVSLALGLRMLPPALDNWPFTTYLWLSSGLALGWLLTGWLGAWSNRMVNTVAFVGAFGLAGVTTLIIMLNVIFDVTIATVGVLTISIAIGLARIKKVDVAYSVALGVAVIVVFSAVASVGEIFTGSKGSVMGCVFIVAVLVIPCLIYAIAAGVAVGVENNLRTGRASRLMQGIFGVLLCAYAFIVWYFLGGGWQLFS